MEIESLLNLVTEGINDKTLGIDRVATYDMITLINEEDKKVALAVENVKSDIAKAVDVISNKLCQGGRLIYVGAGTSGRIGVLDASECPPTFGVDHELVQGIIAGGESAMFKAVEGAEDSENLGEEALKKISFTDKDVVCGIAASGRTPFVIGAMRYGKNVGGKVLCVTMNKDSEMAKIADISISVLVGPEVIMGSTRMKSGTAQKMVLNMLTTGTMIKLGKVYGNLMVDLQPNNEKLIARAKRILMLATGVDLYQAENVLKETNYNVKLSILMIKSKKNKKLCEDILIKHNGHVYKAMEELNIL
ncbi:N-acetylmuramic acid 6-phosphate etherase [Clostridium rectalis]|uniref:N-acetylmuramic acid 6-phosphate etherase n=1 Tax=Clostridium rectalis TaxID=2040295 RepID=UPI000F6350A0|nr:N-acetylmuramic acid 6-phosphate etherase [Clostridium rectalis]